MTTLKLVQSGGMLGKARSAEMQVDMNESQLISSFEKLLVIDNGMARDAFSFTVYIGDDEEVNGIKIDPEKAHGRIKRMLTLLMEKLEL